MYEYMQIIIHDIYIYTHDINIYIYTWYIYICIYTIYIYIYVYSYGENHQITCWSPPFQSSNQLLGWDLSTSSHRTSRCGCWLLDGKFLLEDVGNPKAWNGHPLKSLEIRGFATSLESFHLSRMWMAIQRHYMGIVEDSCENLHPWTCGKSHMYRVTISLKKHDDFPQLYWTTEGWLVHGWLIVDGLMILQWS